jgi:hypothetical protein
MPDLSTKCATTISLLALASLPGDRTLFDAPLDEANFKTTKGYERRVVDNVICHAVDWDGAIGAEAVFRENGHRSGRLWQDFRAWRKTTPSNDIVDNGNKACALLLKHFGPYDQATSEALANRRALEKERAQAARNLEKECPLSLRTAARDYLAPHLSYTIKIPAPPTHIAATVPPNLTEAPTSEFNVLSPERTVIGGPFSPSATVLREYLAATQSFVDTTSIEAAARAILEKALPLESRLDLLDVKLMVPHLPPIPGEGHPADMDLIHYGALICRHRAVIVGVLLADAGFDVEIVEGYVSRDEYTGGHLFVFSKTAGILEPSADGPDFWRKTASVAHDGTHMSITVDGDTVYKFGNRTELRRP